MLSYTIDIDEGRKISIYGYSRIWGWSRNKVKKFLTDIRTIEGHSMDSRGTNWGHSVTLINKDLWKQKDKQRTIEGQSKDSRGTTTINPNTNTNKKDKDIYGEFVYLSKDEYKKLVDRYSEDFTKACIERLDNYIGSSGKKYLSHYRTILNWVVEKELSTGEWEK